MWQVVRGSFLSKEHFLVEWRRPKGSNYIFEKEEENSLIQSKISCESSVILKLKALTFIAATVVAHVEWLKHAQQ